MKNAEKRRERSGSVTRETHSPSESPLPAKSNAKTDIPDDRSTCGGNGGLTDGGLTEGSRLVPVRW